MQYYLKTVGEDVFKNQMKRAKEKQPLLESLVG